MVGATALASSAYGVRFWGTHEVRLCSESNPPKKPQDFSVSHANPAELLSKQGKCCITRRGWLALGISVAGNASAGSFMRDEQLHADASHLNDIASNNDLSRNGDAEMTSDAEAKSDAPLNGLLSLFDTNVKTKSGKLVPKGYLKSARNVVKSLKESLKEDSSKERDVRKSADQAKEAIRDYLLNWRGQKAVELEDSYKALEDAIKILGAFYAKRGPRAILPSDVKSEILSNLEVADAAL